MPRHPPCALKNLATKMLASTVQFSNNKPTPHPTPAPDAHHPDKSEARTGIPASMARPKHQTPTPAHHHQPNRAGHDTKMRGLLFQDPTVYQRAISHQPSTFPPKPPTPPPEESSTRSGAVLANKPAIHNPKSQRPPMSTTHRTTACESGL
jgi:hypothetical protein